MDSREKPAPRSPRGVGWILVAALLVACAAEPEETGPPGAWWVGRTAAVRAVLDQLAGLEGTPVARAARQLAAVLPGCALVGARGDESDFAQLVVETRCLDGEDPLAAEHRRHDAEIAFALPVAADERARGTLRFGAEALVVDIAWPRPQPEGALALLVPGEDPAGPDRLASAGRLVHARVRPAAGIDLGALVPRESQADRLFALRGDLFAGAVLDGTWEGAVYLPERPGAMPGVALALGFRAKRAAVAAADRFLDQLEDTWGVRRSAFVLAGGRGACLPGLNVLPDFAPCYVATDDALVAGWNPASLQRALAGAATSGPASGGRLDVDLALVERADARIARQLGGPGVPMRWPWRRLSATGGVEDGRLVARLTLLLERRAAR